MVNDVLCQCVITLYLLPCVFKYQLSTCDKFESFISEKKLRKHEGPGKVQDILLVLSVVHLPHHLPGAA